MMLLKAMEILLHFLKSNTTVLSFNLRLLMLHESQDAAQLIRQGKKDFQMMQPLKHKCSCGDCLNSFALIVAFILII